MPVFRILFFVSGSCFVYASLHLTSFWLIGAFAAFAAAAFIPDPDSSEIEERRARREEEKAAIGRAVSAANTRCYSESFARNWHRSSN